MPKEVLKEIEKATEEGRLWDPEKLIEDLMLSQETDYLQRRALLGQVALAVDKVEGQWLLDVSGYCYQGGFGWASEGWIERHVGVIPRWARSNSGRPKHQQRNRRVWGKSTQGATGTSRSHTVGLKESAAPKGRSVQEATGTSRSQTVRFKEGEESTVSKGRYAQRATGTSRSHTWSLKDVEESAASKGMSAEGATGTSCSHSMRLKDGERSASSNGATGTSRSRPVVRESVSFKGRSPSSSRERGKAVLSKQPRTWSPIKWEESKTRIGSGCWKCGEWGHYQRDCSNDYLCDFCQRSGHRARECPRARDMAGRLEDSRRRVSSEGGSSVPGVGATSTLCGRPQEERRHREAASTSCSQKRSTSTYYPKERQGNIQAPRGTTSTSCSQETTKPATKVPKFKECPVPWCKFNFHNRKGHTFGYHYPTMLAMEEGQDTRTGIRIEALEYLARELVGPTADIADLIRYLNDSGLLRGREIHEFDQWTSRVVAGVAGALGLPIPGNMTCSPLNSPGCVFHYRMMLLVVTLLGEQGHYRFLHRFGLPERREELEARCPRPEGIEEVEVLECIGSSPTEDNSLLNLRVEPDAEGGREVYLLDQSEKESCSTSAVTERNFCSTSAATGSNVSSTSAVALPEFEPGMAEETSTDQELLSQSDSSMSISPRRSWRPAPSPEVSDMEVVDEVGGDSDDQMEQPQKEALGLKCVDSHFHLDRLCHKIKVKPWNYQKAIQMVKPCRADQVQVEGAVAVWCDPETYPTRQQITTLKMEGVVSVIGIHPSKVQGDGVVKQLERKLDECDVVGLGEVGLDATKNDLPLQRTVLGEVLKLLESRPHLVLVLHCRPGWGQDSSRSYFDLFYRCKAVLRPEQKIHLHCFNGTMEDVDLWLGYFPNTYFGYSLMVQSADFKADSRSALQRIEPHRILLESDAPYFKYERDQVCSSPSYIGLTAQEVARVRGCTREELLNITAKNAKQFYGM